MHFLKWLYREVNPMVLVLALALLYYLMNGAIGSVFGSKSVADIKASAETVVTTSGKVVADQVAAVAVDSKEKIEQGASAVKEVTREVVEGVTQNEKSDKTVAKAINDSEQVVESVDVNEVSSSSVFSRLFNKSADDDVEIATPVEQDVQISKPAAATSAAVAATVIAAAPAVVEAVSDDQAGTDEATRSIALAEPQEEPQVVENVPVEEAEEPAKKSGGFLGLFRGNKDEQDQEDAEVVQQPDEAANDSEAAPAAAEQTALPPAPPPVRVVSADMPKLADARRAYWNRDYAQADALYNELLSVETSNADLMSEYGNMLLQSGQVEKTLNIYEKAAILMIETDRKQDAKPLIDYIASWDKDRADQLINKVFAR